MNKLAKLLVLCMLSLVLIACGNNTGLDSDTLDYRNVTLSDEQSEQLITEIAHFIENTGSSKELDMFDDSVVIDKADITTGAGVTDYNCYISSNAAYFQIGNSMYRFQFNSANKIISYIRYTVEA